MCPLNLMDTCSPTNHSCKSCSHASHIHVHPCCGSVNTRAEVKDVVVEMSKEAKVGALSAAEAAQLTSHVAT